MLRLILTPPGQRPLRTIVDEMGFAVITDGIAAINATVERVKAEVMGAMGLGDVTRLAAAAG